MSVNKVILVGNVGADPTVHHFEGGGCVARVNLATNEWYRNRSGESVTVTEWHRLAFWGRLAESVAKSLRKGMLVYVEGRLTTRSYTDSAGQTRYVTEVVVVQLRYMEPKSDMRQPAEQPAHIPEVGDMSPVDEANAGLMPEDPVLPF